MEKHPYSQNGLAAPNALILLLAGFVLFLGVIAAIAVIGLNKDESTDGPKRLAANRNRPKIHEYRDSAVGKPFGPDEKPWIAHVNVADLDGDGRPEIVACDAKSDSIVALWREEAGNFSERVICEGIKAPAHVQGDDFDQDGDTDLLVASMGVIFPNNDLIGSVVLLENTGSGVWKKHVLIENIARVTDVRAGDFDHDGKRDLAVGQFGYYQGEVRWMRNLGDGRFESKILLDLPGTIHTPVVDFDRDGNLDFAALVSQEFEEVHVFFGDGQGNFENRIVWGSTNEDYGSSGMTVADLDGDGWADMVITNGDGFDYASPGPRAWHGVQWLQNLGKREFSHRRIGRLRGAFSPVVADLNRDGLLDVVACSGFNDWSDPEAVSLRAFINRGHEQFLPVDLAKTPTHLMALSAGDLDGDGNVELITGGFHAYPPWDAMSRLSVWNPVQE